MAGKGKSEILMQKKLLIVFAKNIILGKVKTRLAKTVGDSAAFMVYKTLVEITEKESVAVRDASLRVYFSDVIIHTKWPNCEKFVQEGETLGDRMKNAFERGFKDGYTHIIGIGADLPEISAERIENAFDVLERNDFVFGPAEDGGYYLVGLNGEQGLYIFDDKPWSTAELLEITQEQIEAKNQSVGLLEMLNDIDTIEDLAKSSIHKNFEAILPKQT